MGTWIPIEEHNFSLCYLVLRVSGLLVKKELDFLTKWAGTLK